jgi:hypothetical protein
MNNDLTVQSSAITLLDEPQVRLPSIFVHTLGSIGGALLVAEQASGVSERFSRDPLGAAKALRWQWLSLLGPAYDAMWRFHMALGESLDHKRASAMIDAMLGAMRAKGDQRREAMNGMLDLLDCDAVARATGLWEPFEATPVTLALACQRLIATSKYVPQPPELHDALRAARISLTAKKRDCETLIDLVRQADATILTMASREEWIEPYRRRGTLELMLRLHQCADYDDALRALVAREKAELAKLAPPPQSKRIAAVKKRVETKRSKKPEGQDADE